MSGEKENGERLQALSAILRYAPGGMFVYSAEEDEQFSFVSENMLSMLGYTLEEFTEKFENRFSRMIYREDREATLLSIWSQVAAAPFDTCSYRIEKKDGSLIWVHDEGHIVADEDGRRRFYVVIVDTTSAVNTRDDLRHQNRELQALIDSIPVRVIVYQRRGNQTGVIAINGYMDERARARYKPLRDMGMEELHELIFPDDRARVIGFFRRLYAGEEKQAEVTYRAIMDADDSYRWFRCVGVMTPQSDGSQRIYCTYTDVTPQIRKEEEFDRSLQELLTANPSSLCAFRLNLTQNLCSDGHGVSEYTRQLLDAETADGLLRKIASIIDNEADASRFRTEFSRERLLDRFSRGEDRFSMTYRRMTDSGASHWVTTYFHLLRNPYTDDVEAIAYSVDSDRTHKDERIISLITREEYDCIGLIEAQTGRTAFYYRQDAGRTQTGDFSDQYGEIAEEFSRTMITEQDAERFRRETSLEAVRAALDRTPMYSCSGSCRTEKGVGRKLITFRWLEEDRREIMFALSDVTETFQREAAYAENLRGALLEAEKANEMKSDFLGNVSHDMRTPLNAILGYNRLAMQVDGTPRQVLDYLQKTETAGNTLLALINDTLDLQKIETGEVVLKPEPADWGEVIQAIVAAVQPLMDKKHIDFVVDNSRAVTAAVSVDQLLVREVFINLLSNAVKFTPEGGRVEFVAECVKLEENCVHERLTVRDNGIGISREFQPKMYEPFSQERTKQTAHIGGSGLGLSIVRRAVELMGGRIEAKSEPGKGTEFTVWLDFERADGCRTGHTAAPEPPADVRGLHVLLCEDNEMNAEIAMRLLEMNGISAVWASDGEKGCEAFRASRSGEFDMILMDVRMPAMDGYTAARTIRASGRPDAARIPILAMTADAYAGDVQKCLAAGMNGHISKPLDPVKMLREISRLRKAAGQESRG